MGKEVIIRISAQDAASPVFKKLAGESAAMGASIETTSTRSAQSLDRISKGAAAVGAAIGSATLLMGEFTKAAAEDEASQARVQQAIENTGKSYDDYANKLDAVIKKGQAKAFSDDATRDALTRLVTTTGDAEASMNELGLVMDFARARNIDLATSADIVGKVMSGNLGILSRYGITLEDGATATEALAVMQQRSAGQAEVYANTSIGQLDIMKDKWGELTESLGAHAGALQSILLLLPGLQAGYVALAGALAGFGGVGAAAPFAIPAALLGGDAYLAYQMLMNGNKAGGSGADPIIGGSLAMGADLAKKLTPGSYGDSYFQGKSDQYRGVLDANAIESMVAENFFGAITKDDVVKILATLVGQGGMPSANIANIPGYASAKGLTTNEYLGQYAESAGMIYDPNLGQWLTSQQFTARRFQMSGGYNGPQPGLSYAPPKPVDPYNGQDTYRFWGGTYGEFGPGREAAMAYSRGGGGAVANDLALSAGQPVVLSPEMQKAKDATELKQYNEALKEQLGVYAPLVLGINSANDAQQAFKATQDGLLQTEGVYSHQQSEYESQMSALEAGYTILQQRQADGIPLTKEEQDLLNNYPELYGRLEGGAEDATVAQALLAAQYAENVQRGDELNQTLSGQTEATEGLTRTIQDMILMMDGVPEEVRTAIMLDRADESIADLIAYYNYLSSLPGHVTTVIETQYIVTGADGDYRRRGAMDGTTVGYADGGTVYGPLAPRFANGGTWAMVGERGPEAVYLSRGDQVFNTEATRSMSRGGRLREAASGGGGIHFHAPVTLGYGSQDITQIIREHAVGGSR